MSEQQPTSHHRVEESSSSDDDWQSANSRTASRDYSLVAAAQHMGVPLDTINVMTGHPAPFDTARRRSAQSALAMGRELANTVGRNGRPRQLDRERMIPIICFICYVVGHTSPECPHRCNAHRPQWIEWFHSNFAKLSETCQAWLKERNRLPGLTNRSTANAAQTPAVAVKNRPPVPKPTHRSPPPTQQPALQTAPFSSRRGGGDGQAVTFSGEQVLGVAAPAQENE